MSQVSELWTEFVWLSAATRLTPSAGSHRICKAWGVALAVPEALLEPPENILLILVVGRGLRPFLSTDAIRA